ncbi:hypothetical protein [Rhodococcus wratislaviensis]|uniref:hypothetical protein n=1 Tax=Rhodococcus wratislaviensis TaxID=44752 RepID=UPI003516BE2A
MTMDGRVGLREALCGLREKARNRHSQAKTTNTALAKSLPRRGYKGPKISPYAVASWFREGTPARFEEQLLALVDLLTDLAGPDAPPMRRDEWTALYAEAQKPDPPRPSGPVPGDVLDPETEGAPGDRAPLEVDDHHDELPAESAHNADREHWLDAESASALRAAVGGQTPSASVAVFGRWWQLETWLRELLYLELRAKLGASWTSVLDPDLVTAVEERRTLDVPDDANPLAQLHYEQLVEVIDEHWDVMSYALPTRRAWNGRQHELEQIRGRLGYLRRPHPDDLVRVEQILRDLEHGAFVAVDSYTHRWRPNPGNHKDVVTQGWIAGKHESALRLLSEHVDRDYGALVVQISRRPWITTIPADLSSAPGILWHADVFLRQRYVDPVDLWSALTDRTLRRLLVHVTMDTFQVGFTFSAVDDEGEVADAIGRAFDAVLSVSHTGRSPEDFKAYRARAQSLDFRVQSGTGWTIGATAPMTTFGAGGGVDVAPTW